MVDAPVILQQSKYEKVKVPQIQFLDRVPDIPVVPQRGYAECTILQNTVVIPQVQLLCVDVAVIMQRQVPAVPAVGWTFQLFV